MKIFDYNNKENIISIKAKGVITAKQFLNVYQKIKTSEEYRKVDLKIMIYHTKDSRYSDEILNNRDIYKTALTNLLEIYPSITKADIIDNPIDTAKQMVLDNNLDCENYKSKLFCTNDAALNWIKKSVYGKWDEND
jgi:hypothetical protein